MEHKKIFLFLILGIFLISFVSAALTDDLVSYYKLDESSGKIIDSLGANNGTNSGATAGVTGKINTAYDFDGTNDYLEMDSNADLGNTFSEVTIAAWINPDSAVFYGSVYNVRYSSYVSYLGYVESGLFAFSVGGDVNDRVTISTSEISLNNWHYVVGTYDGTTMKIYVDGVLKNTRTVSATLRFSGTANIGRDPAVAGRNFDGTIDELSLYNRVLTDGSCSIGNTCGGEIAESYNSGSGISFPFISNIGPTITLNSPVNNFNTTSLSLDFNTTVTDDQKVENVSLYIDGILNETNTSNVNGTYIFTKTLSEGSHNWSILAFDNESMSTQSSTRTLEIDTFSPNITITSPTGLINYHEVGENLTLNTTIQDANLNICWFEYNDTEIIMPINDLATPLVFPTNYANVTQINDGFGTIRGMPETCSRAGNFTLQSPGFFPNYQWQCLNEFGAFVTFETRTSSINSGTNVTSMIKRHLNCSENIEEFEYVEGKNSLCVHAIDNGGLHSQNMTNWSFNFLETNRTFNPIALQTGTESFQLSGIKNSAITAISATFTHNGDTYSTIKTGSGYNVTFSNTIDVPVDLSGVIPFYWTVSFTNSTGAFSFNTSITNQTVYNLTLEECFTPSINGLTLNFTTYDSTNMTRLNSTLEATFKFYAESGSGDVIAEFLFSDLNENRSNYMYCLESSGENVTVDAFISYGSTDYDSREYIINNGIIGNFTQDIALYLTLTELTDIVTITVQDQNYNALTGALVVVQRWNIGTNTYSTIGMFITSSTGKGIMDLELYNTWYREVVTYQGSIVKVTDVEKLSSTSCPITVDLGATNPYDLFGDISHGLTFDNETNITSFTWLDSSGYSSKGCLVVKNQTSLGPVTIEDECVESVSGTIDYLLSGDGSYTAYGVIFLEGYNVSQIVYPLSIQLGTPRITQIVSPRGKVISFIIVGTAGVIGVAAGSAIFGVFLLIAVLIALLYFGFLNITWGFIWGIISIGLLIIFLQRRKR